MSGRTVFFGGLMGGLGLLGGWCLWGGSRDVELRYFRERVEVPVEEKLAEEMPIEEVPVDVNVAVEKTALGDFFDGWLRAEELDGALLGFCVLDEEGKVVFGSPLAETGLCPASALKTLTAGAAFGLLGEDYRFQTRLMAGGGISASGLVTGDLVLNGGGDPTLTAEDLVAMADAAVKKGLRKVEGSLRVDASVFPRSAVSDHWVWGDLGNAYGVGAFGLNVGHNVLGLYFAGGVREGDAARFLRSEPDVSGLVDWQVAVTSGKADSGDGVMIYSSPYGRLIEARGTVPVGSREFAVLGAVPDPPRLCQMILERELEKRGVVFSRKDVSGDLSEVLLVKHESAALPEIVNHMQLVSDNLEAQCLFLMMGEKQDKDPAVVLREYWEGMGVEFKGLRLIDGSGLARATMISPVDLARANFLARRARYGDLFFESLPASNNGSVRSKRGAMSGVRTEVGFVKREGKEYTFALMGNGLGAVDFWKLRERLLREVGR